MCTTASRQYMYIVPQHMKSQRLERREKREGKQTEEGGSEEGGGEGVVKGSPEDCHSTRQDMLARIPTMT